MEYKKERSLPDKTEHKKKKTASRLVIEENTIYEIDLECEYQKEQGCQSCVFYKNKKEM